MLMMILALLGLGALIVAPQLARILAEEARKNRIEMQFRKKAEMINEKYQEERDRIWKAQK